MFPHLNYIVFLCIVNKMHQNWIFFSSSKRNIKFKEYCDIKHFSIHIRETDVGFSDFGVHLNMTFHALFFTNKIVGLIIYFASLL